MYGEILIREQQQPAKTKQDNSKSYNHNTIDWTEFYA